MRRAGTVAGQRLRRPLMVAAVAAVLAFGTFLHLWYLFHLSLNSDQAVAALMARGMLHGHFTAFYYGQVYGGSAEEGVLALVVSVFGYSGLAVNGSVMALFAVATWLTWRAARHLIRDRWIGAMAASLVWAAPLSGVSNGTYAYGFRGMTMVCGMASLLAALRILDGRRTNLEFAVLAFAVGVGWWSSPEITYFLAPVAVILAQVGWQGRRRVTAMTALSRAGVAASCFLVGAMPWLWANGRSGLASMRPASLARLPGTPGLLGRLYLYPRFVLPMTFGLRQQYSGAWLGGRQVGLVLYLIAAVALAAAVVTCLAMGGRYLALGAGVAVFPLLLAVSPASANWESGRYAIFDIPLAFLVFAVGAERLGRLVRERGPDPHQGPPAAGRLGRLAFGVTTAALCTAAAVGFSGVSRFPGERWWSGPDDPSLGPLRALEGSGVRDGYADYWVAYRLDALSGGTLRLTVGRQEPDRDPAMDEAVRRSPRAAWVFVTPSSLTLSQFGITLRIEGPDGIGQARFVGFLRRHHIDFQRVKAGFVEAVVPDRNVTPEEVAP